MIKFSNDQRLEILKQYYQNSKSMDATLKGLIPIFDNNNRPTKQDVRAIVDKFESTYSLLDDPAPVRERPGRSKEPIATVRVSQLVMPQPKSSSKRKTASKPGPKSKSKKQESKEEGRGEDIGDKATV